MYCGHEQFLNISKDKLMSINDGFQILIEYIVYETFTRTSYGKKGDINYRVVLHQTTMHVPPKHNVFHQS